MCITLVQKAEPCKTPPGAWSTLSEHASIRRLRTLTERRNALLCDLEQQIAVAYYEARVAGRFEQALEVGPWSRTVAVRATRHVNESLGRHIRWSDEFATASQDGTE